MPLYLDEIWLDWRSPEEFRETLRRMAPMDGAGFPWPEGVRLEAGPWFSNEEGKIVLILDIADHSKTFQLFGLALGLGTLRRRRLTPIVPWTEVGKLQAALEALK